MSTSNHQNFTKTFQINENLELGDYVFSALVEDTNSGSVGTTSILFTLIKPIQLSPEPQKQFNNYYTIIAIIAALIFFLLILNYYWNKRLRNISKEINKRPIIIKNIKPDNLNKEIKKLQYKKILLEKAHKKGYIKPASYKSDKRKINETIRNLKKH